MAAERTPIVAGNWKMHTTVESAIALAEDMLDDLDALEGVEVVLCPPFVSLHALWEMVGDTAVTLGAQNMDWRDQGAYTGEISPLMLAPLCRYVIVGHSERRAYFGETDEVVARKAEAALAHGLRPIICVGEDQRQNEAGETAAVLERQVRAVFSDMTTDEARGCVVAYEPIWAIGTGRVATPADAQEVCGALREALADKYGTEVADEVRVLYGGSVKSSNVADLVAEPDIDGALVGGASLDADEFAKLCALAAGGPLP
jgi:triosephosphate isomerase (TIM)